MSELQQVMQELQEMTGDPQNRNDTWFDKADWIFPPWSSLFGAIAGGIVDYAKAPNRLAIKNKLMADMRFGRITYEQHKMLLEYLELD